MTARSALVTGGTTGLGLAIAHRLAGMGLGITITGRDPSKLAAAVAELEGAGASVLGTVADAADWDDTEGAVAAHVERHGGLDVAVANAGFTTAGDLVDGDPGAWRSMVLTNVLGPALLIKAAVPRLPAPGGQIVLVGSVAGRVIRPGSLYSVTKHAVASLGENARLQLTASGIRVATVEPGVVDTPFWDETGMPPVSLHTGVIADAVAWIVDQPAGVEVGEIVVRPTGQLI